MINLLQGSGVGTQPHHRIRLNHEFRSDLQWWQTFVVSWNRISFWRDVDEPAVEVFSDASGHWGCEALSSSQWLAVQWPDTARLKLPIAVKEFLPILLTAVLWGHQCTKRRVQYFCNNEEVVAIIRSRTSRQPHLMHLSNAYSW